MLEALNEALNITNDIALGENEDSKCHRIMSSSFMVPAVELLVHVR